MIFIPMISKRQIGEVVLWKAWNETETALPEEPEFQPSTAPHELDRFVLALAAMEVEGGSCQAGRFWKSSGGARQDPEPPPATTPKPRL